MNSAIYKALSKATGITYKKGDDKQAFLADLVKAIAGLKDPEWDKLSEAEQDWYNGAASAKNKKQTIPDFPDLEAEEEEQPRRSSRRKADDEGGDDKPMLKVGDTVTVKTNKGTERTGEIIERDAKIIVIKDADGEEWEYKIENLESITAKHGNAKEDDEKPRGRRRQEEPEEPAVPELKKGDKVVAVTKRGKTIEGVIEKISDTEVSIDDGKEVWDFDIERLESLSPVGGKAAKEDEPEEGRRSARGAATKEKEEPATRTRSNNGEVSIGQRIRELIAEDFDITLEALTKALHKEKLEFKDNTVALNYKEAQKFIEILRKAKRLK